MYHEHPIRILKYSIKNLWLLIFPLIRGIHAITFDVGKLYHWIKGAWFDIAVLAAIIIFGLIRWYFSFIRVTDSMIIHIDGVFMKVRTYVPYEKLSSVTLERTFYLRPFGAMRLNFDTSAGVFNQPDLKLIVGKKTCRAIIEKAPRIKRKSGKMNRHKTSSVSLLLFSVFFSSSFSGAVYLAAFFFKGGDISREIIAVYFDKITQQTSRMPVLIIRHIPAAAIGIGLFFLATWLISFVLNVLRYYGFSARNDEKYIEIECGSFSKRKFRINQKHINYVDYRQSLLMKIFGAESLNVNCAGYGSGKNELPVIVPLRRKNAEDNSISKLWKCSGNRISFRPGIKNLWTYIWLPVILSLIIIPLSKVLPPIAASRLSGIIYFLIIMAEIPTVWMIIIKFVSAVSSRVAIYGNKIEIIYSKGFGFHRIIADKSNLIKVDITQTPFQKKRKRCTISFYLSGEQTHRHFVKALSCEEAEKICLLLGYDLV